MPPITVRAGGSAGLLRPLRKPMSRGSAQVSKLKSRVKFKVNGSMLVIPSPAGEAGYALSIGLL
jgi:hypothetical protein